MKLETRSFEIRKVNEEARTITGIAAPWGEVAQVGGYKEAFERGAFEAEDVKLFYGHQEPIGLVTESRDTDDGYEITARISDTARGNEVYTLLRDGVLNKFSVGFVPVEERQEEDVLVRTKVLLKEVSLVPFPAYTGAKVSEVRQTQENNKKEDSNESQIMTEAVYDDTEIRGSVEDLERRFSVLEEGSNNEPVTQFRSAGEFIKAVADGSENAEVRAYTGAVLADSHTSNDWKADLLQIVDRGRPVLNLFDRGPLGNHGNSVEFPKVSGVTGDVAAQAAEGDDLAYIKLAVTTGNAPIKTYGAYSELSRQVIERSDVSYLDAVLKAQAASYAKITNGVVRAALVAATPQTGASLTLASAKAGDFLGAVVDAVQKIEDAGVIARTADALVVSTDVWKKVAALVDSADRPVFDINRDGANTVGTANVQAATLSIAGIPVVRDSALAAKSLFIVSSNALMTWEDSRSPIRLDDENPINLTKVFSIYGYLAAGVKDANGIVKAVVA